MSERIIKDNRRFTCLSNNLVRIEFDPSARFQNKRSLAAFSEQKPVRFKKVEDNGNELILETEFMKIISTENDKEFFPDNLEIQWKQNNLLQFWRPGDRDHQNLGGTLFSLDALTKYVKTTGVHVADSDSPDAMALRWNAANFVWQDLSYYEKAGRRDIFDSVEEFEYQVNVQYEPEKMLIHSLNNIYDQYKYAPGILSKSGYFLLNDSKSPLIDDDGFPYERNTPGTSDWYFFCYGSDYKAALSDFILLTGKAPLPSKNTFGMMFCRWPAYSEAEAKELIERFEKEGLPLSAIIIDMEWHNKGWCNWDWNKEMYPDPKGFYEWCHKRGIEVSLNVHPQRILSDDSHYEPLKKLAADDSAITHSPEPEKPECKAFMIDYGKKSHVNALDKVCLAPNIKDGLDYWWLDGSSGKLNGAHKQLITSKAYYESSEKDNRRGMLLTRYGGVGSHRYGAFFTGDTKSEWEVVQNQCEFNIRAGQIGMTYVTHDIGGFWHPQSPIIDPIRYIRWLQFAVFSPMIRFHASPGSGSRHPWDYGDENMKIASKWLKIRNQLIPYIYTHARKHYDTGMPLIKGLHLEHPEDKKCMRFDEYYFGDSIIAAPILSTDMHKTFYLPEGEWYEWQTGNVLEGGREYTKVYRLDKMPLFVKPGAIIPMQKAGLNPAAAQAGELILEVYPCASGCSSAAPAGVLYEDDNYSNEYKKDAWKKISFSMERKGSALEITTKSEGKLKDISRKITLNIYTKEILKSVIFNGKLIKIDEENRKEFPVKVFVETEL